MFLSHNRFKSLIVIVSVIIALLDFYAQGAMADSVSIKGSMKIQRMGGYVIFINYETRDEWTDDLVFKVYCEFEKGKLLFTSGSLDDIERGWHKTEISISEATRRRYGSLCGYKIDLYSRGVLVDTNKNY